MIGRLLGRRYEILERVGGGGWAVVYRASDTYLGRPVAVKVLRAQYAADEEFVRRFRREAQAAASLSHPNVVGVYDVGEEGDTYYIVMEYVDGVTLRQRIEAEGPLPVGEAIRIAAQILDALEHAHTNNIVHRDIKPHNILVTRSGRVKVTDFGIARAATTATLTHTGSIVGSAHYFSPEQARGGFTGVKSDLYSVGVVLYEMLTGQVPFNGESPISVAIKHIQEQPLAPSQLNPSIPPELEAMILRAMEKEQARRYQSAREMLEELNRISKDRTEGPGEVPGPAETRPAPGTERPRNRGEDMSENEITRKVRRNGTPYPRRRSAWPWLLVLLALAVSLGYGGWSAWQWLNVPDVTVPDVTGKTQVDASETLLKQGLRPLVGTQVSSDKPSGVVLDQDPKANSLAKRGRDITLTVSTGPELTEIPSLKGKSLAEAQAALDAAGLRVGKTTDRNDPAPRGTVIDQIPGAGQPVLSQSYVDLVLSTGKTEVIMPALIRLPVEEAKAKLKDLGLTADVGDADDGRYPPGVVVDQNPEAGVHLAKGDKVKILVNRVQTFSRTILVSVPRWPQSVRITVVVNDRGVSRTVHDQMHMPGEIFPVTVTWTSEGASYQVLANGNPIAGDALH